MSVAIVIIVLGVLGGLVAGAIVVRAAAPDLDDPHVERRTVRHDASDHPVVGFVTRIVPRRAGPALAEAVALAAIVIVITGVLIGLTLAMIRTEFGLARADTPIARWAADNATDRSTQIMRELSEFGGTAYVVTAAVVVAAVAWWRDRRAAVIGFAVIAMIGQFAVSNTIKWSVDRARPDLLNLTGFSGTSFPSGHAVAGAAVWTSAALLLGRGRSRRTRAVLFGAAIGLGVIVAGTRVGLGVHWTTDVIIGLAVGWSWFAICAVFFGGRRLRPADPLLPESRPD